MRGWENLLQDEKNRWKTPSPNIDILVSSLPPGARVLDIGCGAGRHVQYLLENGFSVAGFDIAENARKYTLEKLHDEADIRTFDMLDIPWPYTTDSFDGALSINVIHHTNYQNVVAIIAEIRRVLVSGGTFIATIPSKENHKFQRGPKVDEHTFITDFGAESGIPHSFFDEDDLHKLFKGWSVHEFRKIQGEIPDADKELRKSGARDHWLIHVSNQ